MLFSNILNKATVTTSHIRNYNSKGANSNPFYNRKDEAPLKKMGYI